MSVISRSLVPPKVDALHVLLFLDDKLNSVSRISFVKTTRDDTRSPSSRSEPTLVHDMDTGAMVYIDYAVHNGLCLRTLLT